MFKTQMTDDGSLTFFSLEFDEYFHSTYGAKQEAEKKFIEPCQLLEKAQKNNQITILDICYGLGYNSAAALASIWLINPQCHIKIIALENDINVPLQALKEQLLSQWTDPIPPLLTDFISKRSIRKANFEGLFLLGDARQTIQDVLTQKVKADVIFLDPFSPPHCPQLWTVEFLKRVANCLELDGYLATYSCAASVRTALQMAGLNIGSTPNIGRKTPGTIASFQVDHLPPLSLQEEEHLKTRAAIPYRDPTLTATTSEIIEKRQQEQQTSDLEPTSRWKKRWSKITTHY